MQVWHSSSSESKKCVKCGKVTGNRKVYEQNNIEIRIPLCDNEREERQCYYEVDVKFQADMSMKLIKNEIDK